MKNWAETLWREQNSGSVIDSDSDIPHSKIPLSEKGSAYTQSGSPSQRGFYEGDFGPRTQRRVIYLHFFWLQVEAPQADQNIHQTNRRPDQGQPSFFSKKASKIFKITKEPVNVVKAKSGCEPRNIVNSGYFKLNSTYHWAIVTVQYPGPGCQWRYTYDNCSSP